MDRNEGGVFGSVGKKESSLTKSLGTTGTAEKEITWVGTN